MVDFSEQDVKRVAQFVLSKSHYTHYRTDEEDTPQYRCDLCQARLVRRPLRDGEAIQAGKKKGSFGWKTVDPDIQDFRHNPNCIYLVAQDLLA